MAIIRTLRNEPPDDDTLGGRLSRTRDAVGMSATALARRVGVKPATILAWESDRSEPNVEKLSLLAGVLDVNMIWLLHGVGDAPTDEIGPDPLAAISVQLERLRRIHEDTGQIIERLHRELARLNGER
ncbi:MAG: helix-turn-helix domain-containing protein [Rhizobiaceae bacterium]|nr:helix-turn-helix domain-containing protein [Rhizobiaceae bacterium]MCV0406254.1 helix-turn-helix domain-containing protein [Rhizobiaceae bacterium]